MKKRLLCLLLALLLTAAAPEAVRAAFTPVKTYTGQFRDVSDDAWYAENVKVLYELGLTVGRNTAETFAPLAEITVAEVVTLCARLRSLSDCGDSESGPAAFADSARPWYHPYAAYLRDLGVIGEEEFKDAFGRPATRAEMARILAGTLPTEGQTDINGEAVALGYASRLYITDVDEYTPYQQEILTLYRRGIVNGMDAAGSFHPDSTVQRCQVAAMVTRLADPALRITLDWSDGLSGTPGEATLEGLVRSDGTFHTAPAPTDRAAVDANIRYMLSRGERRMVLSYPRGSLDQTRANEVMSAFLTAVAAYPEQTYNTVHCSFSPQSGSLVLTFSSSLYSERMIDSYREAVLDAAVGVRHRLWSEGTITAHSTETEKARAYYTWLCGHCRYDTAANDSSISHSAYGAFVNGLAVCDGYTAAYNLLLKLEGIDCSVAARDDHVWTAAVLDGQACHIDPTWGDQTGTVSYRYFAMTEAEALSRFS